MKTLIFINQKGGVGKTLSAQTVGACLHRKGNKVLFVDLDPSGNLTKSSGIVPDGADPTLYEVLRGKATAINAIRTAPGGYDILPTDIRQTGTDIELATVKGRDTLLKKALESVKRYYDFIIIDSPPSLSIITLMGLAAASDVIITAKCDYLSLDGIAQLLETINAVKKKINRKLNIAGVLLTFYDGRLNLSHEVAAAIAEGLPGKVFDTKISQSAALGEAPAKHRDIYDYRPRAKSKKVIAEYEALTDEIIARIK